MGHMHEYGAYQHIDWISNGVEEREFILRIDTRLLHGRSDKMNLTHL